MSKQFAARYPGTCPKCGRRYPKEHALVFEQIDGRRKPVCAEGSCAGGTTEVRQLPLEQLVELRIARVLKFWLEHVPRDYRKALLDQPEIQVRFGPGVAIFYAAEDLFSIPLSWLLSEDSDAALPDLAEHDTHTDGAH